MRYKVKSGEFELFVNSNSLESAAQQAIRIHNITENSSQLGPMIIVGELDGNGIVVDEVFIQTISLIDGAYRVDDAKVRAILAELEDLERTLEYD